MDYPKFRLRSFTKLSSRHILQCGSFFELPAKYCIPNLADEDAILYAYDICAIPWNRNPPKNSECTVLRIDSKQTPPGFAKLKVDRDSTGDNPTYFRRPPLLRNIKTGGPSKPCEHRSSGASLHVEHHDIVFAVYCPYWPVEAEEWRKRKRFHGWPNEKLIARITRGGCHFVSKLRTWSSCDDTEWRFSFSKAELLLVHSWTPAQKFTYHIIRVIKRRISESCGGDGKKGLQTYYFKTLMFWACEEFPPEFWGKQNLESYAEILFYRFLRCLDEKFCPNYFIPECNIMCHLKNEGNFEKELQMVQKFLTGKLNYIEVGYAAFKNGISVFAEPFEYSCLYKMEHVLPLSEKLNGRLVQYLTECDWFLPEMKNLHSAIEAHLRLMSIDSVTERQTSKDYAVSVENFHFALIKREEFEMYECFEGNLSVIENWIRIFSRKFIINSTSLYCRICPKRDVYDTLMAKSYPSLLSGVTSAYRANFYFTAMKSYNEARIECEKCIILLDQKAKLGFASHSPCELCDHVLVLMCNSLSQIFDEHLQVILGFATLHRNISSSSSANTATSHEVCLKLDVWCFLHYIYFQCEQKLHPITEVTDACISDDSDLSRPYMSQVINQIPFSAVILFNAMRHGDQGNPRRMWYKPLLSGSDVPLPSPVSRFTSHR